MTNSLCLIRSDFSIVAVKKSERSEFDAIPRVK